MTLLGTPTPEHLEGEQLAAQFNAIVANMLAELAMAEASINAVVTVQTTEEAPSSTETLVSTASEAVEQQPQMVQTDDPTVAMLQNRINNIYGSTSSPSLTDL